MSDLHIETINNDDIKIEEFIKPSADILILAGDIGKVNKYNQLKNFLRQLCLKFKIVLYVLGNNEYYRVDKKKDKTVDQIFRTVMTIKKRIPNLYILNRNSVIIGDVCIAGCTLWTKTDYVPNYIVKIPNMNTNMYNSLFQKDLEYIENMVEYCKNKKLKLLVVTHHCPTYSIIKEEKRTKFTSIYCSELDHLLDSKNIHTWICGHVHINFDLKMKNGTRLVSNQKGKKRDNIKDFSLDKIIMIE